MKRIILFTLLSSLMLSGLYAIDYGALVIGEFEAAGEEENDTNGTVILAPWLSLPVGNDSELYVSAGIHAAISDESYIAPELFRLEFSSRISPLFSFRLGRFTWQDVSGLIAKGRFDGADFLFDLEKIKIGASALYTGFLFKDTSGINISPADTKDYNLKFDFADFENTYFAPRRFMASLYGTFPGFPPGRGQLHAGLMAQFDLSGADEAFHTQYLMLRHTLLYKDFDFDITGIAELENTEAEGMRSGFAFSMEGGWQMPTALADRLSLGLAWASGEGSATAAFFPVTREPMSFVLKPVLSGIMIIGANYQARVASSLSATLGGSYFLRTDSTTFTAPELEDDSYALGAEIGAGVQWVPFSDLSFSLKGGVFLPKTGSAWSDSAPLLWRITLGTIFSF
jgi:hypothetical protein